MAREGKWLTYAQHECLFLVGPIHGSDFIVAAMQYETCPKCGKPSGLWNRDTWAKVVRRKIRDGALLKPWTWGDYHWEYRMRGHLEEKSTYRATMRNATVKSAKTQ